MKQLLILCFAFAIALTTQAQQSITPDTLVSFNADDICFPEDDQLFEFSDGSKALMLNGYNSTQVSSTVDGTNYSIPTSQLFRVLYAVDASYQFKEAITIKSTKFTQVGDTLYGVANAKYGETLDLNPAGTPLMVTAPTNPDSQLTYLVAYNKDLQLVQHALIHANTFSTADIATIKDGKIYVLSRERDSHPQGTSFTTMTNDLEIYDMNFNLLTSYNYYTRQGAWSNFHVLHRFLPATDGFYGYFTNGYVGLDVDISLNGQPAMRSWDQLNLGYLAKYDNNLNLIWDSRIRYTANSFLSTNRIYDSPNGDSLLWVGLTRAYYMYYQNGANVDTLMRDTSYRYSEHICTIDKNTGQLLRHHSGELDYIYGDETQMLRYLRSMKSNFSPGVDREYLNFWDNTFQVPDSTDAIAIYDDPTTGIPTTYRMLGYVAPNDDYFHGAMLNSSHSNTLYLTGRYANTHSLDNTASYTLSDYNGNWSTFLGAYALSPVTGTAEEFAPEFELFPNPCTDYIQVRPGSRNAVSLQVVSIEGKVLQDRSLKGLEEIRLEMSSLPAGMYFVQITYRNGEKIGKRFLKR